MKTNTYGVTGSVNANQGAEGNIQSPYDNQLPSQVEVFNHE